MCLDKVLPMSVLTEGVGPYSMIPPKGASLPPDFIETQKGDLPITLFAFRARR